MGSTDLVHADDDASVEADVAVSEHRPECGGDTCPTEDDEGEPEEEVVKRAGRDDAETGPGRKGVDFAGGKRDERGGKEDGQAKADRTQRDGFAARRRVSTGGQSSSTECLQGSGDSVAEFVNDLCG